MTCICCCRPMRRRRRSSTSPGCSIRRRWPRMRTSMSITWNIAGTWADQRARKPSSSGRAVVSDLAHELPRRVVPFDADLRGLASVAMRKDPQQEVRPRCGIVGALDHDGRTPPRVEALADLRLLRGQVEPLLVPLQHGVAADDAFLVAAFVGTPAVDRGVLPLADGGRAR